MQLSKIEADPRKEKRDLDQRIELRAQIMNWRRMDIDLARMMDIQRRSRKRRPLMIRLDIGIEMITQIQRILESHTSRSSTYSKLK